MRKFLLFLSLSCCFYICAAQNNFTGTVVDEQQQPLPGVTVTLGKNTIVAVTDSLGNYSFQYSTSNYLLAFSYVGFVTQYYTVINAKPLSIILLRNSNFLSEAVVKAFERNANIDKVPAAISVLNKASLERYNNESFVPAINTVPGVKMDERSPGSYRLSIRGNLLRSTFGVRNVKVYWNGIPFTDANGNTYFNQLSLNNIGKIEIIKGPAGSMYGAGTGGVVLLSSSIAAATKKELIVQSTAGSYGLFSANAAYNQTGKNNTSVSFSHQQSDGYRVQTNVRRDVGNYTGSYLVSSKQRINANVFYSDLYYQTPGGLTLAELRLNPRQARPAAGAFQSAEAQKAAIYLKTIYAGVSNEYRFNSTWNNTTSVYASYTDFANPTIRNYEDKYERGIGARTVFQYKGKLLTHTFGGEYQSGFLNTGVYGNRLGVKDTLQYNDEINSRQYNAFAQTELALSDDLVINAGFSYNNFYYGFDRINLSPAVKQSSSFKPQLVPRISALLKISTINIYGAVSKGYSPPSIDEVHASDGIFNTALAAETGWNYEMGIKGNIIKNKLWLDASYYIFGLQNTIVSRRDSSGADYYVNAGRTDQKGLEVALNYLPVNKTEGLVRQLKLFTNYTNIHARFKNYQQGTAKYDGNKLTGTAPNVFVAGLDINTAPGIYTNATYTYTDRIPLNDANSFFATSYNLLFVKAGYKTNISKIIGTDIFVAYERSFNNPYSLGNDLNATGNRFFNPSAPHNFTVGAKFQFQVK